MKQLDELDISPAPWEYEGDSDDAESFDVICHLENGIKYQVAAPYIHFSGQTDANARLIAAAPKLYKALYDMLAFLNEVRQSAWWMVAKFNEIMAANKVMKNAESALAEAAGESEVTK